MPGLLLFRHAKSDRAGFSGDDFERPLNQRGVAAARRMGGLLAGAGQIPGLVLCSTALRARSTLELAMASGGWHSSVRHERSLYLAGPETMRRHLIDLPDEHSLVMIVAHEPGLSEMLGWLVGGGAHRMPTAAVARVDLAAPRWGDLAEGRGELQWLVTPRLFPAVRTDNRS